LFSLQSWLSVARNIAYYPYGVYASAANKALAAV
jgi:hypothetical protein